MFSGDILHWNFTFELINTIIPKKSAIPLHDIMCSHDVKDKVHVKILVLVLKGSYHKWVLGWAADTSTPKCFTLYQNTIRVFRVTYSSGSMSIRDW